MLIVEAEKKWRDAYSAHERIDSLRTLQDEQAAWDAYTDLCNDIDQCQQPGCREIVSEYAYCSQHRP